MCFKLEQLVPRYLPLPVAVFFLALTAMMSAHAAPVDPATVKPGMHCPNCDFAGLDLTNQCVKNGNLSGADFDRTKLVLACMSFANFRSATFRGADLSGANLSGSKLDDADFSGAIFSATQARGTDFSRTKGLTQAQLDGTCGDAKTRAPAGLRVRPCQ